MLAWALNLGFAAGEGATPAVAEERPAGGWFWRAWSRYRDEEDLRQQRIALEIIPPDEPSRHAITEAARSQIQAIAKRKLRELANVERNRLAELESLLSEVMEAQRAAREQALSDLIKDLSAERDAATNGSRKQNAIAALVMLGAA